jgi:hypothetical protein
MMTIERLISAIKPPQWWPRGPPHPAGSTIG